MKIIKTLSHDIKAELADAEHYIDMAVDTKVMFPKISEMYMKLSEKELEDALAIHKYAVAEIDEVRKTTTPPEYMLEMWNEEHKELLERVTNVKNKITMLKN